MANWYKGLRNLLEPKVPIVPILIPYQQKIENSIGMNLGGLWPRPCSSIVISTETERERETWISIYEKWQTHAHTCKSGMLETKMKTVVLLLHWHGWQLSLPTLNIYVFGFFTRLYYFHNQEGKRDPIFPF